MDSGRENRWDAGCWTESLVVALVAGSLADGREGAGRGARGMSGFIRLILEIVCSHKCLDPYLHYLPVGCRL